MNLIQVNKKTLDILYNKYNKSGFNTEFIPFNIFTIEILDAGTSTNRINYKIEKNIINIIEGTFVIKILLNHSTLTVENTALYKMVEFIGGTAHKKGGLTIDFSNFINSIELYNNGKNITAAIPEHKMKVLRAEAVTHIQLLNSIINYIMDDKQVKQITSSRTPQQRSAGNKKNKKKSKKITYITNTKYIINGITEDQQRRAYNKQCDAWDVRGHWRTYKNGRKIWIPAYKKGNKDIETVKNYKIR